MVRLHFTTVDSHDALTRALGIFRVMDLPVVAFDGRSADGEFHISIAVDADPALADALLDRLGRVVSVRGRWAQRDGGRECDTAGPNVREGAGLLEQAAA